LDYACERLPQLPGKTATEKKGYLNVMSDIVSGADQFGTDFVLGRLFAATGGKAMEDAA